MTIDKKLARRNASVLKYVNELSCLMGLTDWTFRISGSPCDDANLAEVDCVYGQRLATIALAEGWDKLPASEQRGTLVHELTHALLSPLTGLADDIVGQFPPAGVLIARAALTNVEEWVVDAIACAWAETLPLPKGKS